MAKTIAVWGSPRSGKTSFATKLARTIYDNYDCKVLCVYTDFETPSLPVLFPSFKAENLYSIGNALSQTDITQEGVVKQIVQLKDKMNIGFLGFKDGDNLHSYPQFRDVHSAVITTQATPIPIPHMGITDTISISRATAADTSHTQEEPPTSLRVRPVIPPLYLR